MFRRLLPFHASGSSFDNTPTIRFVQPVQHMMQCQGPRRFTCDDMMWLTHNTSDAITAAEVASLADSMDMDEMRKIATPLRFPHGMAPHRASSTFVAAMIGCPSQLRRSFDIAIRVNNVPVDALPGVEVALDLEWACAKVREKKGHDTVLPRDMKKAALSRLQNEHGIQLITTAARDPIKPQTCNTRGVVVWKHLCFYINGGSVDQSIDGMWMNALEQNSMWRIRAHVLKPESMKGLHAYTVPFVVHATDNAYVPKSQKRPRPALGQLATRVRRRQLTIDGPRAPSTDPTVRGEGDQDDEDDDDDDDNDDDP